MWGGIKDKRMVEMRLRVDIDRIRIQPMRTKDRNVIHHSRKKKDFWSRIQYDGSGPQQKNWSNPNLSPLTTKNYFLDIVFLDGL